MGGAGGSGVGVGRAIPRVSANGMPNPQPRPTGLRGTSGTLAGWVRPTRRATWGGMGRDGGYQLPGDVALRSSTAKSSTSP